MKRTILTIISIFLLCITLFAKENITMSFLPIEGNMTKGNAGVEFANNLTTVVTAQFIETGFNVLDKKLLEEAVAIEEKEGIDSDAFESSIAVGKRMNATHILVVSADSWKEEETNPTDILLSIFNTSLAAVSGTATRDIGIKQHKNTIEKYRISVKIVDLESSYVVATGMAQGRIDDAPSTLSENAVNDVTKQLENIKKIKNSKFLTIACMPPEGSTNNMAIESKLPYLIAVESAFINRGDKVGDRNRLETIINEIKTARKTSRITQILDPAGEMIEFGKIMKVSYFASVSVDTWVESRTSGLDVFNAIAGVATALAAEESAKNVGREQNKDLVQKVRVTIKIIDIESSYILAAGIAQGEIGDDPMKISAAAMKDLEKQLKNIEKIKKKILKNPISVACLPAYGSMDDGAKGSYISAIEVSLIKNGYKVADRNNIEEILEEIKIQKQRGSVIEGETLDIGKIMKVTHLVVITADVWDEESTSGLDVFKTLVSTATAIVASDTVATTGGKESRDIVANARLGVKIVDISNSIILASGIKEGRMKDNPTILSDNVLKQINKQVKKASKSKKKMEFFVSSIPDGGSLDEKSKIAYVTATESVLIEQGIKVSDSSISDDIISKEIIGQRILGSEDEQGVIPTGREYAKYIAHVSVDAWEEERISGLSIAKILFGSIANVVAEKDTSYQAYKPIVNEEDIVMATTKHVRYTVKVVDTSNNEVVLEASTEGMLKDSPIKLAKKALKNANKLILNYEKNKQN